MGKEAAGVPRAGAPHHPPFPGLHLARASSSRQRPPYPPHRPCKTPTHSVGTTHRQLGPRALSAPHIRIASPYLHLLSTSRAPPAHPHTGTNTHFAPAPYPHLLAPFSGSPAGPLSGAPGPGAPASSPRPCPRGQASTSLPPARPARKARANQSKERRPPGEQEQSRGGVGFFANPPAAYALAPAHALLGRIEG